MARTIEVIKQQIIDEKNSLSSLDELNSPSQTAIWNLWAFVSAVAINLFEQILDIFRTDIEAVVAKAGAGTLPWLRAQILKFQYSSTNPQYVVLDTNTLEIAYPVINEDLQVLTRVAVTQQANRIVNVKVAQQEPPVPLDSLQKTALQSYLDEIAFAGTQIIIINSAADSLIVAGTVYYTGQYSSTISTSVIDALEAYCLGLSSAENFGSVVRATDVIKAVLAVAGVVDFKPTEISVRPDGVVIGSRNKIFELSSGTDNVSFETISGYIVQETTTDYTFNDTLTFIAVP